MSDAIPLFANPGQTITLATQVVDGYGTRVDGYGTPQVESIIFPDLAFASGYPQAMTRVSTGLYIYRFAIPTGSSSIGTFIASISFNSPATGGVAWQLYTINVAAPFGNSTFFPG